MCSPLQIINKMKFACRFRLDGLVFNVVSAPLDFRAPLKAHSPLRMGYCCHCSRTYVLPYVRPSEIFFGDFCFFGILMLVVLDYFFIFWKKWSLVPATPFFLTIFLIYKGVLGARCKSGDLCWKGFVCRFWIYIVVCPDLFFAFLKKTFLSPAD